MDSLRVKIGPAGSFTSLWCLRGQFFGVLVYGTTLKYSVGPVERHWYAYL